jgi:hypothetical protein
MGLGSGKTSSKGSKTSDKSSKKSKGAYRSVGSIWENVITVKGEEKTILNFNIDNRDPDDEYHQGSLVWLDAETGKAYKVKSMNLFPADKGPKALLNKVSINLENEHQVEEE